jgi:hypothetical protein
MRGNRRIAVLLSQNFPRSALPDDWDASAVSPRRRIEDTFGETAIR